MFIDFIVNDFVIIRLVMYFPYNFFDYILQGC
jgi:hypothetical protein